MKKREKIILAAMGVALLYTIYSLVSDSLAASRQSCHWKRIG